MQINKEEANPFCPLKSVFDNEQAVKAKLDLHYKVSLGSCFVLDILIQSYIIPRYITYSETIIKHSHLKNNFYRTCFLWFLIHRPFLESIKAMEIYSRKKKKNLQIQGFQICCNPILVLRKFNKRAKNKKIWCCPYSHYSIFFLKHSLMSDII